MTITFYLSSFDLTIFNSMRSKLVNFDLINFIYIYKSKIIYIE